MEGAIISGDASLASGRLSPRRALPAAERRRHGRDRREAVGGGVDRVSLFGRRQRAAWGGAGGRSEAGDASVAISSATSNRTGRYRIDGLRLRITYVDGSVESQILIADPADPRTAI
jgi:hypothetical protein